MAIAKWIPFGVQQPVTVPQSSKHRTPVLAIPTADAKKFGLENFGNTCYANSVLQALYFCAPFRDLLLQSVDPSVPQYIPQTPSPVIAPQPIIPVRRKPERKQSNAGHSAEALLTNGVHHVAPILPIPSNPPTLFSALRSLFLYISTNPSDKGTVAPRAFIDKLKEVNESFRSTMHQDAHEFLNYLLNKIVEEIEEEKKVQMAVTSSGDDLSNSITTLSSQAPPTIVTQTTSSNSGTPPQDATLVHKLFEGVLTSETRCLTCETVSSRDESFLDLSIDIEQNSSVTACLRQFSASEMLCQKNKFFCDSCCDLQEAEKRMKIKKLPNVLALHLKRFKQEDPQKFIKLAYRVAFPFELRLFNTVDDSEDADRLYELFGIVVHIGNGPHHGHYISIIKSMGVWLVFDDDNVYSITESDIPKYFGDSNAGSAYVLYYQATNLDPASIGLRTEPTLPDIPISEHQHSPLQTNPALPPGLVDEHEHPNPSPIEPVFPIPPSPIPSSPLQSFIHIRDPEKRTPPSLTVNIDTNGDNNSVPPSPSAATTTTHHSLLQSLRRAPSIQTSGNTNNLGAGPDGRRQKTSRPATSPGRDSATPEEMPPPPVPLHINGKEKEKEKHPAPEKKASTWFGKRKSFRLDKSRPQSPVTDEFNTGLLSPIHQLRAAGAEATPAINGHLPSSAPTSPGWFRTSGHHSSKEKDKEKAKKYRRPSEPNSMFDVGAFQPFSATPRSSTVGNSINTSNGGYESPSPGSATSSFGSTSQAHSSPQPNTPINFPSQQTGTQLSLPSSSSSSPPKSPDHKKSLSSIALRAKIRDPQRPSTAGASVSGSGSTEKTVRPLPPVPPLPPTETFVRDSDKTGNGHASPIPRPVTQHGDEPRGSFDRGKARASAYTPTHERVGTPTKRPSTAYATSTPGLDSFAGSANHSSGTTASASTSTSASSNLKRATRKLSLTAQLGFGRRDKDKDKQKDKDKDKERVPPSAFGQHNAI